MAVTLRYFTEFGKRTFQHISRVDLWRNLCTSLLYFVVRVRCHRKESSRSLSHLLMSFLYIFVATCHPFRIKRLYEPGAVYKLFLVTCLFTSFSILTSLLLICTWTAECESDYIRYGSSKPEAKASFWILCASWGRTSARHQCCCCCWCWWRNIVWSIFSSIPTLRNKLALMFVCLATICSTTDT